MTATFDTSGAAPPHGGGAVLERGAPAGAARAVCILLHGRGASAEDILSLAGPLETDGVRFVAPDAHGGSWYPHGFLSPMELNRAGVESAHAVIELLLAGAAGLGIGPERCAIVGFSQGACLATTHPARYPRAYGFIGAFTGGLIGPLGHRFVFEGSLSGADVFLGANDPDPFIPWERVEETARVLESMGAGVRLSRYPGEPHAVNRDELRIAREALAGLAAV